VVASSCLVLITTEHNPVEQIGPRDPLGDGMEEVLEEAHTVHSSQTFHRVVDSLVVGQEEAGMILMPLLASCSNRAEAQGVDCIVPYPS
jgi:hypothetical protein